VKKEIQNIVDPTSPNPSKGGELADEVLGDSSREGEEKHIIYSVRVLLPLLWRGLG